MIPLNCFVNLLSFINAMYLLAAKESFISKYWIHERILTMAPKRRRSESEENVTLKKMKSVSIIGAFNLYVNNFYPLMLTF